MSTRTPRTPARRVRTATAACTSAALTGWALAAPASAHAMTASTPVYGMTSGRLASSSVAVLALVAAVVGGLALARARRSGAPGSAPRGRGGVAAVVLGLLAAGAGAVLAATADGGLGSGSGVGGAVVAVVLGLAAVVLGGLAATRAPQGGTARV